MKAAFDQAAGSKIVKKTGPKDVRRFILERIKNQYADPRPAFEFVVESGEKIVGYVELFDMKEFLNVKQCERGIFITPEEQASGYGKEAILALTDFAFTRLGIDRVFTMADPDNIRSIGNIIHNSGGVKVGEEDSKYSHLQGGGKKRTLFHIYPENFYAAVRNKGNEAYLIKKGPDAAARPGFRHGMG
jgi:hypothetical protein